MSIKWWSPGMILLCSNFILITGCSTTIATIPQVGHRAIPEIFLADRPTFTPLTQTEFDAIPIQAKGKILKNQTDWAAYADVADAAIKGYRSYIQSIFDKEAAPKMALDVPATPAKKWYQFWK